MSGIFKEIKTTVFKNNEEVLLFPGLVEFIEITEGTEQKQLPVAEEDFTPMQRNFLIARYGKYFRRQDVTVSRRAGDSPAVEELKALTFAFIESVEIFSKTLPTRVSIDGSAVSVATIKAIQGDFMSMADQLSDINDKSAEVEQEQAEGSVPGTPAVPVGPSEDDARVDTENNSLTEEGVVADEGGEAQASPSSEADAAPVAAEGGDDTVAAASEGVPA